MKQQDVLVKTYIPEIDGLRALAVLAVVIYHMGGTRFLPGGFVGVDVFFVISGYVISHSLYRKPAQTFSKYILGFYARRVRRIIPAMVVCVLVTIILSVLFIPSSWLSSTIDSTSLSALFGVSNFSLLLNHDAYFSPKVEYIPLLHTWSLAVEEQFYLIFPVIFFLWLKGKDTNSWLKILSWIVLIGLAMLSFGFSIFESSAFPSRAFYLLPSRFWELIAGVILFQIHTSEVRIPKVRFVSSVSSLVSVLLLLVSILYADRQKFPFPWALVPVFGTILILNFVAYERQSRTFLGIVLQNKLLGYIGKISFSLYLWHWPIAVLLRWTIGFESIEHYLIYFFLSLIISVLSYHYIERSVLDSRCLSKLSDLKMVGCGLAVILLAFAIGHGIVNNKELLSLSVTKNSFIWRSGRYERDTEDLNITVDPEVNGRRLFVLGDSHTAAYRTMLNIASAKLGIEVYEFEKGGCAVAGLMVPMSGKPDYDNFYRESYEEIKNLARSGDIIFLASLRMPELFGEDDESLVLEKQNLGVEVESRRQALTEASNIIKEFQNLGLIVILDAPKPLLKSHPYRVSDYFNRGNPAGSLGLSVSRRFLEQLREPIMESINYLQQSHRRLFLWDSMAVLCKEDTFYAYDAEGLPILFDSDHLTAHGNRLLVPSFIDLLQVIWRTEKEQN